MAEARCALERTLRRVSLCPSAPSPLAKHFSLRSDTPALAIPQDAKPRTNCRSRDTPPAKCACACCVPLLSFANIEFATTE